MAEVSEQEWQEHKDRIAKLQRSAVDMGKAVDGLPRTSTADLKSAVEGCIGPHCSKITEQVDQIGKQIDHLDTVVHNVQKDMQPPPGRSGPGHEQHETWPEAADCPTCGLKMKAAVITKFKDELQPKPEPWKSPWSDDIKAEIDKVLSRKKVPHCTDCMTPAEMDGEKPKVEDCPTCGSKY